MKSNKWMKMNESRKYFQKKMSENESKEEKIKNL